MWCHAEVATVEHGRGDACHDGLPLHVEVAVPHLVGAPPADEADAVAVDATGTHHCHGPWRPRPSGMRGHVIGSRAKVGVRATALHRNAAGFYSTLYALLKDENPGFSSTNGNS